MVKFPKTYNVGHEPFSQGSGGVVTIKRKTFGEPESSRKFANTRLKRDRSGKMYFTYKGKKYIHSKGTIFKLVETSRSGSGKGKKSGKGKRKSKTSSKKSEKGKKSGKGKRKSKTSNKKSGKGKRKSKTSSKKSGKGKRKSKTSSKKGKGKKGTGKRKSKTSGKVKSSIKKIVSLKKNSPKKEKYILSLTVALLELDGQTFYKNIPRTTTITNDLIPKITEELRSTYEHSILPFVEGIEIGNFIEFERLGHPTHKWVKLKYEIPKMEASEEDKKLFLDFMKGLDDDGTIFVDNMGDECMVKIMFAHIDKI